MAIQNIVLIHGWASDGSIWQDTQNYLEQKYPVYMLNLPMSKNIYSYRDAVIELIEHKDLYQVMLVGWSMGALIAIQVTHQLPHKVQGLLLVSGTSRFLTDSQLTLTEPYSGGIPAALIVRMKKRLIKNREQTITDFYKLMLSPQEEAQGLAGEIIGSALSRGRTWDLIEAQAGLDFLAEADVRAELKRITCPTLLIHGEQDEICPIGGAEFIQRQIPCAQLISYPWVGHIPFLTNFKDFHRALERWLNSYDNK